MKPRLMRHSEPLNESFKIWKNGNPYRHNPWHYHPECEITYIYKGKGSLFVGDQMVDYGDNELIMTGPNLPHEFRSDIIENPDFHSQSVSIHFSQYFLGEYFYELPEVTIIKDLLVHSAQGVRIDDSSVKQQLKKVIDELLEAEGAPKIYKVLEILHIISQCRKLTYLASNSFVDSIDQSQDHRINQVYAFVMKNFTKTITVEETATLINMTPTSFCRFFKDRTHKQFIQYLTEVRIGYACRLLLGGELSISQVAYTSGFGNLSHFNKQFKNIKQMTPSQFIEIANKARSGIKAVPKI